MSQVFIIHHNPSNGRYAYPADPEDAIASASALLAQGESTWVAGNCRRMLKIGDLLLFKFGGSRLRQEPGIYAAAHVTQEPVGNGGPPWVLRYQPDAALTSWLMRSPVTGTTLSKVVSRSYGASIQPVQEGGRAVLAELFARAKDVSFPPAPITHGLLVLKEPLDRILTGEKTWEIRSKATKRRGPIALIESKSGHVVGSCEVVDVVGPLTLRQLQQNVARSCFRPKQLPYRTTYAWVVRNARRLDKPVPYRHPSGAVIWVRLEEGVPRQLGR